MPPRTLAVALAATLLAGACTDDGTNEAATDEAPARAETPEEAETPEPANPDDGPRTREEPAQTRTDREGAGEEAPEGPPVAADDPEGLAQQITAAERAIRSDRPLHAVAREGHLQQVAYRAVALRPQLRDAVLAGVPPDLRGTAAANIDAAIELARLTDPQEELPAWRIVDPPPADELLGYYREAEAAFGVGWEYLAAIHLSETRMGRIQGTSPAGAQGPMQFMPGTWEAYGQGDVYDPRDAILAAGRYLAANGAPDDMDSALFSYNRSDAYVNALQAYADEMRTDPRAFHGYYHWQVYYVTTAGDRLLPVGYDGSS